MRDTEKREQKEIEDLESRSKKLYELVVSENFTVEEVIAESYATSFTPHSEMIMGGTSPVYQGGFTSRIILKVKPDKQDVPVRTLNFDGISAVKAGEYISAQIPRYKEKRVGNGFHSWCCDRERIFYFDRGFNSEESAIELALLSEDRKVLRIDRAVNYKSFHKE